MLLVDSSKNLLSRLCLIRCKLFSECKIILVEIFYERENIFRCLFWVLGNIPEKYFLHLVMSIFLENIVLHLGRQCKKFSGKCPKKKKKTYNTIEHLKMPIHIIYAHPLIPITKNRNIVHIQVLHNNERGTPYKNHNPNTTIMVIHPSLDVPFY